ncbi:hypothetical protein [Ensifer sp. SSB1]|jgi:hypothetical protein|uniref:hypothetical protein n=1 Tax=Ensifer sp. SSB1 TaxID=2795385 RepID=UPI001A5D4554|nr:hypothetical protein [Ensifer sp. SSB1]MBK5570678.1 hypothetical protein [Ensifer sp. SSB1]
MHTDISRYSTADLLQLSRAEDCDDLAFRALCAVFKRWDGGIDLSLLIDLIDSEVVSDRLRASYYLYEVSPRFDSVKDAVLKLADDVLAGCRRAFVGYLVNSGWYDDTAAEGLVNCLHDSDLDVRLKAIKWAILTTDERFEDVSRRVVADFDMPCNNPWTQRYKKRGLAALTIARRVRSGESVAEVRTTTPGEDSFSFEYLEAFEGHSQRRRTRRLNRRSPPSAPEAG